MKRTWLVAAVAAFGCATVKENPRTAAGAGGGAATGAVVGGVLGGGKGAAVGGVIGGAVGGVAGHILDKQAAELKQKDINASRTANGILVKLKEDLLFDVGSDSLKPQALDELNSLGDVLAKYPQDRIQILGFTDSTGSEEFNDELSKKRAEAVRKVLVSRGLGEQQAVAIGMGEQNPIAPNDTAAGRSKNRRVELHIAVAK
ncbi:MAG: OmpA family protein [Myxococcales bacterium]|nr:OmpA family protein [Myxococcales bacterium]